MGTGRREGDDMVQFNLPKGSRVMLGKTWPKPEGTRLKEVRVYRWNPDEGGNPQLDTFFVDLDKKWRKHTLSKIDAKGKVSLDYRPVHTELISDGIELVKIAPKARVF